jgi:geranylgeranyl diphosphate synthase type I
MLAPGRVGEDLAVVVGDYLFARSIEVMLGSGLTRATQGVQYYLEVCRHAATGQYLDLDLARLPLVEVTLFQTLKVAKLKSGIPGFTAPLVTGALLAGAKTPLVKTLRRVGHQMGVAFQLRDDLLGLFGEPGVVGKPCDSDLIQGKRTFPLVAAYARAPDKARTELEDLWSRGITEEGLLHRARELVETYGGRAATESAVTRASRAARRSLQRLPAACGWRDLLSELIDFLSRRDC